jgi:hypothetical protein
MTKVYKENIIPLDLIKLNEEELVRLKKKELSKYKGLCTALA